MSIIPPASEVPSTEIPSAPAPKISDRKVWSAGTLTYTSGGLVVLFCWLLFGDFAWSMRDRSVGPMAQWYLNSLNVPNVLFGLLISSFPALLGLILGPIISVKSDRHRGRWGRRIPFLLITTPFAALGMIGLSLTPMLTRWLHGVCAPDHAWGNRLHALLDGTRAGAWLLTVLQNEMVVAVVCFGVFWAIFEVSTIAAQAVFGGLINDVVPRPLLGRFYGLFRAISLIDGMIFNYWIMGVMPSHFALILMAVGIFYALAFFLVCTRVKEGAYPPPPAELPGEGPLKRSAGAVTTYFKECFSNPYYLSVFLLITAAGLVFLPVNTFAIPYARSLGIGMDVYGRFLALTFLISLGLSFFLGWLADRFHPLRMAMFTLAGYALVSAWGACNASDQTSFLIAWVLHGVLSGCYMTSAATLAQRLFPQARFAQFASAAGITGSFAHMGLAPLVGSLIDNSGHVYRHTFTVGCVLALIALAAAGLVHRQFMRLGGPTGYVPPG